MKCPLLGTMRTVGHGELHPAFADCIKEKCAWWNNTNDMCAILQLSKSIYFAGLYLPEIKDRMPVAKE